MLFATLTPFAGAEGSWQFCRLRHAGEWNNDYPRAGRNLTAVLDYATFIDVAPTTLVVSTTGEDLSRCTFVVASNIDGLLWTEHEAKAIGDWLHKGGFLWADGFWSDWAWDNWSRQLRKALPKASIWELHTHPIFESPFPIRLQQPCPWDGWVKHFAVKDDRGRLMVLMTFNEINYCDGVVGDSWESFAQSWQDDEAAWRFSINVFFYVMTH